jgi:hypothetical protein
MSYAQFGLVEASDFNNLAGGNPVTSSGKINTVWATGGGSAGYGQTSVGNVTVGTSVAASNWASIVNNTTNAAAHQGSSITSVTAPSTGNVIIFNSAISSNLTTIYNNRLNASSQGSTTPNAVTFNSTWSSGLIFTHTVTFASGDAARYFFNAGGQLSIQCSHPSGSPGTIDQLLNGLASNIGTVYLSAPTSGSITISGTSYNGITKVGGGGNSPTISTNNGYYALTSANANVFTQTASTGPGSYLGTFIRLIVKSNGTQGSNGDAGNIITIYTIWDEVPDGLTASSNSVTTLTIRPPSTTYIANTWGAITLSGTVSGS